MTRLIWQLIGFISVGLGIIGIFLPVWPTTPFLLLAAVAFSRSSDRFYTWLTEHPHLGPPINNWRAHGAISPRAKLLAVLTMVAAFLLSLVLDVRSEILILQGVVLAAVSAFLLTRPSPPA